MPFSTQRIKSVSFSVVKNEADIIEAMVRHNLQFLSEMTFLDNGSTDGTREILQALADEGLPISLRVDRSLGHPQHIFTTSFLNEERSTFLNEERSTGAFVFLLDADELIDTNLADFAACLEQSEGCFHIQWRTYVSTVADDVSEKDPIRRMVRHRRRDLDRPVSYKVVVHPGQARPITAHHGSHTIDNVGFRSEARLRLAHFPVRSPDQLAAKALLGSWNVTLRGRSRGEAAQWYHLAKSIRKNGLPDRAALELASLTYAWDKIVRIETEALKSPEPYVLRYGHLVRDRLLAPLIDFADQLVGRAVTTEVG